MVIMEKLILILGSSILLFVSCCNKNSNSNASQYNYMDYIDSSINCFILRDTNCMKYIDIKENNVIDDFNKGEGICLSNSTNTEWLYLVKENGGYKNQYNYYYLLDTIPNVHNRSIIRLSDSIFMTSRGIHIGSSIEDFKTKYKEIQFKVKHENEKICYSYYDTINQYSCIYIFKNGRLCRIEFGYVW